MSRKSRGITAERDLIHRFWAAGWAALRVAGSGSSHYPSPDVLASNNTRKVAIEAKLTTEQRKYFPEAEIRGLRFFAEKFGAEPWVAVKYSREGWRFYTLDDLRETGAGYALGKMEKERGLGFEELVE